MIAVAWSAIGLLAVCLAVLVSVILADRGRFSTRFDAIDARFDAMTARFDTINERFDTVNERFDGVNARIDALGARLDARIDQLGSGSTNW